MKRTLCRAAVGVLTALVTCLLMTAAVSEGETVVSAVLDVRGGGQIALTVKMLEGQPWLFLPAHADFSALTLHFDQADAGVRVDPQRLTAVGEGVYTLPLGAKQGGAGLTLHIMRSENLRALYLFSDDPLAHGREWLEDCEKHENETTASMAIVAPDGTVDHAGAVSKLRGRGNGTWGGDKRPYQFKLTDKVDLLKTGDPDERSRTWVLLAMAMDGTFLHDKIALDLGLEMGLSETPHSEYVDLYYDGDYRGTYLLAEKVEVGKGRIDIVDFDEILEAGNKRIGVHNVDALPVASGLNRYGLGFSYIQGVSAPADVGAGGYLVEMESELTLSERCLFYLSDGHAYSFKNPEAPSAAMAQHVSELLEEGLRAASHHGVDPETGVTLDRRFELESLAKTALLSELSANLDGFVYSSTTFVLPQGQQQFRMGPPWDFDLAWRARTDGQMNGAQGLKDQKGWLTALYGCKAFRDTARSVYENTLYPLVQNVLLGTEHASYLKPLHDYVQQTQASRRMNARFWSPITDGRLVFGADFEQELALMRAFVAQRSEWLLKVTRAWDPPQITELALTLDAVYTKVPDTVRVFPADPWVAAQALWVAAEPLTPAAEQAYATWRCQALLAPMDGAVFAEDMTLRLNGTPLAYERLPDGTLRISCVFEDRSYRPAEYYGEDLGLVFDAEWYAAHYPEAAEAAEGDPEALIEDFYYDGMLEGRQGNEFFNPRELLFLIPEQLKAYREELEQLYWQFMTDPDNTWLVDIDKRFTPAVTEEKEP